MGEGSMLPAGPRPPDPEAVLAAVIAAARGYFAARRLRVDVFVDRWFTLRGSLSLHRHALGWDVLRAPANVALAPVHVAVRLGASAAGAAGRPGTAAWLRRRRVLRETEVMRAVERLILTELLELPAASAGEDALPVREPLRRAVHLVLREREGGGWEPTPRLVRLRRNAAARVLRRHLHELDIGEEAEVG